MDDRQITASAVDGDDETTGVHIRTKIIGDEGFVYWLFHFYFGLSLFHYYFGLSGLLRGAEPGWLGLFYVTLVDAG